MTSFIRQSVPNILLYAIFFLIIPFLHPAYSQQGDIDYFVDGVEAFEDTDYNAAFDAFKKAVEINPSKIEYQYYLGITYSALKKNKKALEILENVAEKEPVTFIRAYFDIAAIFSRRKDYQKAIDTLNLAERINPEMARIYLEKAYAYKHLEQYGPAIENLDRVKKLDPKLTQQVCYDTGSVYFHAEQFDRSEEMFQKAIKVNPETVIAKNARLAIPNVRATKKARRPWYLCAFFAWAYDDNVPLDPLERISPRMSEVSNKGDEFQNFFIRGGYKFINRKNFEAGAGYSLNCIGYKEWSVNNVMSHAPHVYLQYNTKKVYLRTQYEFSYFYSGGGQHEQDSGFYLTFGDSSDDKLKMHGLTQTITVLEPFHLKSDIILNYQKKEYLDGLTPNASHYAMALVQSYKIPKTEIHPRLSYKFGYEDSHNDESSYRYHDCGAGIGFPVLWRITGDLSFSYLWTDFQNFPGNENRRDQGYIFAASLTRPLTEGLLVQFYYNYCHNNSNMSVNQNDPYRYRKNICLISLTYTF